MTVPDLTLGVGAGEDDQQGIDWDAVEMGPVIVNPLRLKLPDLPMSSFPDDVWSLRPMGLNRGYVQNLWWVASVADQQYVFPSHLTPSLKRVAWLFINKPSPSAYLAGSRARLWPAPSSITQRFVAFRRFAHFLGDHGIARLCDVSADLLDTYATGLLTQESPMSPVGITNHLGYIATISHLSEYLPEPDRMVEPSWGERNLISSSKLRGSDNGKEIIHPDTFSALLWWCQQILDCGPDIIAAAEWVTANCVRTESVREKSTAGLLAVEKIVDSYEGVLPEGVGTNEVAGTYLAALHGGGFHPKDFSYWRKQSGRTYSTNPDLAQPIPVPITCTIEGRPWLQSIDFRQVHEGKLQRILNAAAAVLICTCTGMRGEECVKLPRDAIRTVPRPDGAYSYRIDGRIYKGVRDANDQQDRSGKRWVWATIKPGADAIAALERLADVTGSEQLITYSNSRSSRGLRTVGDTHATPGAVNRWIGELIEFANELSISLQLDATHLIPADPAGNVRLSRFRRSVAWHIVNQPEGLLAAGVQFGHMKSTTTDGYASTITSGIAATMDDERTQALYTTLQDHANAAKNGMKVSGPAAKRLGNALNRYNVMEFPGTYANMTSKDERRLRNDADMVVRDNPGHACLCLADPMKPETMACSRENDGEPNRNDCKTYCGNRVYTDATVAADKEELAQLRLTLKDVNPIMAARINNRIKHLEQHTAQHEDSALPLLEIMSAEEDKAKSALPNVSKRPKPSTS